jgi:hypothetical protein
MKWKENNMRSIVAAFVFIAVLTGNTAIAQDKYVGAKFCGTCHKTGKGGTSYAVWEKSSHAKAYQTLMGEQAKKIAKEKGLDKPPHESEACLKCHVTGGGKAANVEKTFKMEEGVTCEVCHGPASGYKIVHSKGDIKKSVEAGLIEGDKSGKLCLTCHNAESPTFKGFKFEDHWAKIAHQLPPKK